MKHTRVFQTQQIRKISTLIALLFIAYPSSGFTSENRHSPMLQGPLGLNVVPNARMDETGTIRANISTLDPYLHTTLGFQLAKPLYVQLRQTAEISNLNEDAERLYPGIDLKIRLLNESDYRPAVSIGLQSAIGHKRMAGEYIALSKRYNNFDFTAGLGWGRFGTAGHFKNPLKIFSSHFEKERNFASEMPNEPSDWFTGENIGFFGGIEYFTPYEGLSIKADIGADRYTPEQLIDGFNTPAPWSIGVSYTPKPLVNAGLAVQGTDKLMGRLSFQGTPSSWPFTRAKTSQNVPLKTKRTGSGSAAEMKTAAVTNNAEIFELQRSHKTVSARLALNSHTNTPYQIGRAIRGISNTAGQDVEEIAITPHMLNLKGPNIVLMRRDFENALARHEGSSNEIWHNAKLESDTSFNLDRSAGFMTEFNRLKTLKLTLKNEGSLSEEDEGFLYRSSLIADVEGPRFYGLLHTGAAIRLNIHDNLDNVDSIRPRAILPVRSNVADFADNGINLEHLYALLTHSFTSDYHAAMTAGFLEEMYGGFGGEILYRPFKKRFALGAESWIALKRDPNETLAMGFNGDSLLTGHINAWYNWPKQDLTLKGSFGRYLAEDIGGSLELRKTFENGSDLKASITITDQSDFDLFGGTTNAYHTIRLSMPLGSVPYILNGSNIEFEAAPFGRDTGQSLRKPKDLYDLTTPLSYDHLANTWDDIIQD